jgi:hypothetical protein
MATYGGSVVAVLSAAGALLFACAWRGTAYSADENASLSANLARSFTIVVESNLTTGYSGSAKFDASRLRLKSSSYERPAEPRPGAGGTQASCLCRSERIEPRRCCNVKGCGKKFR